MVSEIGLNNKNFLIAGQLKTSLTENLEEFLLSRCNYLGVIGITSPFATSHDARCSFYRRGKRVKNEPLPSFTIKKVNRWSYPLIIISYLVFIYAFCRAAFRFKKHFNIYVGISTFSALFGLLFRKFGLVDRVIYYCLDYYPEPNGFGFKKWLNELYRFIEPIILRSVDFVWDLSPRIAEAHQQFLLMAEGDYQQTIVPVSYRNRFSKNIPLKNRERWTLGFVGSLSENQGLQLVVEVMPRLIKRFPKLKVRVIGHGTYAAEIHNLVKKYGMEDRFIFHGFIKDENEVNKILSCCILGLAPYTGGSADNSAFTEPGKPKLYLMLGLPVVVTKSVGIASLIDQYRAGQSIEYSQSALLEAITSIISKDDKLEEYYKNVEKIKPLCNSDDVYGRALAESAKSLKGIL